MRTMVTGAAKFITMLLPSPAYIALTVTVPTTFPDTELSAVPAGLVVVRFGDTG